jgi:hypothetical protein
LSILLRYERLLRLLMLGVLVLCQLCLPLLPYLTELLYLRGIRNESSQRVLVLRVPLGIRLPQSGNVGRSLNIREGIPSGLGKTGQPRDTFSLDQTHLANLLNRVALHCNALTFMRYRIGLWL